jgi:hypothetical protein
MQAERALASVDLYLSLATGFCIFRRFMVCAISRIVNADFKGTRTGFQRGGNRFPAFAGMPMTMPCWHR